MEEKRLKTKLVQVEKILILQTYALCWVFKVLCGAGISLTDRAEIFYSNSISNCMDGTTLQTLTFKFKANEGHSGFYFVLIAKYYIFDDVFCARSEDFPSTIKHL